jgi:transposase
VAEEVDHTTGPNGAAVGFHRIAVIEGSARRRRFSPEEKARIVAESLDPAVSASAVAQRHGINPSQLFTWRRGAMATRSGSERAAQPIRSR